jgi:pimeloyl-ACP methyl ester carboxylesterase
MLMITIDGGTLSYDVSGAGPPIVFVAGLGEHGTYWMAQVAAFSSTFQVVTFDHGGVGASEGQPPYKVEQWAPDTLRAAAPPNTARGRSGCMERIAIPMQDGGAGAGAQHGGAGPEANLIFVLPPSVYVGPR